MSLNDMRINTIGFVCVCVLCVYGCVYATVSLKLVYNNEVLSY